jgi:hypothetical protein
MKKAEEVKIPHAKVKNGFEIAVANEVREHKRCIMLKNALRIKKCPIHIMINKVHEIKIKYFDQTNRELDIKKAIAKYTD